MTYKVNGLGQRVQKNNSGTKTRFVYNEAGNLLGEYDGSAAVIIEHVWLNGQLVGALKPNGGATDIFYVYTDQIVLHVLLRLMLPHQSQFGLGIMMIHLELTLPTRFH